MNQGERFNKKEKYLREGGIILLAYREGRGYLLEHVLDES